MELHDKLCEFISRYKHHIEEPSNRKNMVNLLQNIASYLLEQEETLNQLKEEKAQLDSKLKDYQKRDKERVTNYIRLMKDLKDDINELIECTCKAIDPRKHQHVDEILHKTYEVIHKLDEIPEAVK